jgi:hypothetical protein
MEKKVTKYRSRDEWRKIIADQEAGGESIPAYCRQRQLSEKSFYYWRKRLICGADARPEAFVRLTSAEAGAARMLCIQTPGGYRLEVPQGTDGAYVQSILAAVAALR